MLPVLKKEILIKLRKAIQQAAPKAEELISYNMPAFKLNGMLVYYAAYKEHIGFYPGAVIQTAFKDDLAGYETSKGTIKFPIGKSLPLGLIKEIVKYRAKQNMEKAIKKKMKTGKT